MRESRTQAVQKALSVNDGRSLAGCAGCFGYAFGFVFSTMFFGVGCLFLWLLFLGPYLQIQSARSWEPVPCTILSSKVEGNETYRVAIEYAYEFDGRPFQGDRYSFVTVASSGREGKKRVVDQYPEGSEAICYVNPQEPEKSVIERGFVSDMWWGLFPIPFILIGLAGYGVMFFARHWLTGVKQAGGPAAASQRQVLSESGTWTPPVPVAESVAATGTAAAVSKWSNSDFDDEDLVEGPGPITLKPESSRAATFVFLLIFSLTWNGVTWGILSTRFADWQQGKWQWMPELFMVPFALVGLVLIAATIHQFLALFNPIPVATLSRQMIPLGGSASLSWKFDGSTRSIRTLKLLLKGIEEARYRRGTSTYTDTDTFLEEVLVETSDPFEIAEGETEFRVPTGTMHSFNGDNNKIKWTVQIQGDIPLWPDVDASFPIRVVPHE